MLSSATSLTPRISCISALYHLLFLRDTTKNLFYAAQLERELSFPTVAALCYVPSRSAYPQSTLSIVTLYGITRPLSPVQLVCAIFIRRACLQPARHSIASGAINSPAASDLIISAVCGPSVSSPSVSRPITCGHHRLRPTNRSNWPRPLPTNTLRRGGPLLPLRLSCLCLKHTARTLLSLHYLLR